MAASTISGMARAALLYAQNFGSNRRPQGASTITQQVAKNFLLTNEVSFTRKIKEALLAMRIERAYSKDKILELYLNEIYLGLGAYGIAAASLVYFDKSVNELTVAEASYLAALPKAPGALHPVRNHDRAIERRNYVIDRLLENGWIKQADADTARKDPLIVTNRSNAAHIFAGEYFAEEVRRDIFERYGEKKLYEGGLSVRTTLDPKLQVMARKTMAAGLVNFDEAQGWRGAQQQARHLGRLGREARRRQVAVGHLAVAAGGGAGNQRSIGADRLSAGARTGRRGCEGPADRHHHARWREMGEAVRPDARQDADHGFAGAFAGRRHLCRSVDRKGRQPGRGPVPAAAVAGGFRRHGGDGSLDRPRAGDGRRVLVRPKPVQPRHPGLSPAGLDHQADRVFVGDRQRLYAVEPCRSMRRSRSIRGRAPGSGVRRTFRSASYHGPTTLRNALKQSLNTVTVRLAQDIGMPLIGEYAKRFGVYDELPNYLSYALGTGETTVMRMVTAYSMFANGGRRVKATLIDRIQDRYGHTIFKHDARECRGCDAPDGWKNQTEPQLVDRREQVLDVMTAYQITSMMEGVVQGGTATVMREVGKPIAGKTGTTTEAKDLWFVGFSPDLVVGLYLGYDKPRSLGRNAQAGHTAAPIARDFMKLALADKPAIPFKMPAGIKLIRVDAKTGMRAGPGDSGKTILEAFKPGTAPAGQLRCHRRPTMPMAARSSLMSTGIGACSVPAPAGSISVASGTSHLAPGKCAKRLRFAASAATSPS